MKIIVKNSSSTVCMMFYVILILLYSTTNVFAQTDLCTTEPAGEVVVNGTSCSYSTFNKSFDQNNGTAYWQNTNINNCSASKVVDLKKWFKAIFV